MSRRLKITLPETVAAQLDEMAANTGEPVARLAGQMVREGIAEAAASGHVRPQRTRPAPAVLDTPEDGDLDQRAPCEELAFQVHLSDYGGTLRREGGSVSDAWKPGAPPDGWIY